MSDSETNKETFSFQSSSPNFVVTKLVPSTCYTVKVWSSNTYGDSDPIYISVTTRNVPDMAERKLRNSENDNSLVWLSIFISLAVMITIFITTVSIVRYQRRTVARSQVINSNDKYYDETNNSEMDMGDVYVDYCQANHKRKGSCHSEAAFNTSNHKNADSESIEEDEIFSRQDQQGVTGKCESYTKILEVFESDQSFKQTIYTANRKVNLRESVI